MRVYVACLAAYNNGHLHGRWIECTPHVADMEDEVTAMLAESPMGEEAEEWAIHDHEGFPDGAVGEFTGLDEIARLAEIAETAEGFDVPPEVLIQAMADLGAPEGVSSTSWFWDHYARSVSAWDEDKAWAGYAEDETRDIDREIPDWLEHYVDWEAMGRDWRLNGEAVAFEHPTEPVFYFFRNC